MRIILSLPLPLLCFTLYSCNNVYSEQLELAKHEKCDLFSKYEQLKTDTTNAALRSEIQRLESMLDMRKELSENETKFTEDLKNYNCK